ncbi:MAG: arginine--tRNA ligase [Candidatus Odinarchaeia archaeon]
MVDPWNEFKSNVTTLIQKTLEDKGWGLPKKDLKYFIEEPPDNKLGDMATTICFNLSKKLRKAPIEIAKEFIEGINLEKTPLIKKVEIAGAGYLNFFVNWLKFTELVLKTIENEQEEYGSLNIGKNQKVIVEHTSANPTKPIHLGTLRTAVLGDITARLLKKAGFNVEVQNYMDDLGRQVAVLTWGYMNIKEKVPKKQEYKDDFWLGLIYTEASKTIDENEQLEEEIRQILKKMEEGDNKYSELALKLVDMAVKGQLETTSRLNIFYDLLIWEKDIVQSGLFQEALTKMLKSPKVYKIEEGEDAGCIVIDMSSFGDIYKTLKKSYKILVRSDGISTYTGKDIAFQMWKFGLAKANLKFKVFGKQKNGELLWETNKDGETNERFGNADKVVNVIGYEQKFPQQVVYHALKIMGYEEAFKNSYHLSFQHVWLPEQIAFSGRKGTWIGFHSDAVLDKAVTLAYTEVDKRNPDMPKDIKKRIAEIIGVGAVKFYLAKYNPEKKIVINWKEAINFEGDSAPYIQYVIVRINSILKKTKEKSIEADYSLLKDESEIDIIRHLSKFPSLIKYSSINYQYHLIPQYALQLSNKFNVFYHKLPVLKAKNRELRNARIQLIKNVKNVLKICLSDILGIDIPEKM